MSTGYVLSLSKALYLHIPMYVHVQKVFQYMYIDNN